MTTTTATTIEIRNATYAVRPIDPGFAGVAALEVTKLVNGESYAVVLESSGRATCECPDFVCRRADKGTHCKHIKATIEAGLLAAPVAPAIEPGLVPVWEPEMAGDDESAYGEIADEVEAEVAPEAAPAPATTPEPIVPPITPADLKRARYFGLTLPRVAMVAPAIEPGLVPEWEPELAGDDESAFGTAPDLDGLDHWSALARRLAA